MTDAFQLFNVLPLWGEFVFMVVLFLVSVEVGFSLGGIQRRKKSGEGKSSQIDTLLGATLGLLAFMLAFTFGMAESRFSARKALVLKEANAIGTTYLRTELLPEPDRTEILKLLREYVEVRVKGAQERGEALEQALVRSEELHDLLWSHAVAIGKKHPDVIVAGLFIQSLNEVIDLHSERVTIAVRNRIPGSIWMTLYAVGILAMLLVGYQAGLSNTRSTMTNLALVVIFAAVLLLIADLDRPKESLFNVSQQSMVELLEKLNTIVGP
jgi:hypothetical protein